MLSPQTGKRQSLFRITRSKMQNALRRRYVFLYTPTQMHVSTNTIVIMCAQLLLLFFYLLNQFARLLSAALDFPGEKTNKTTSSQTLLPVRHSWGKM